jgi:MraZ protein
MADEINKLNQFVAKNVLFKRHFLRGATGMTLGGSDRVNIPQVLLDYANIKNEVVLACSGDRIEIWEAETYYAMMEEEIDMAALAEEVMGGEQGGMPTAS